MKTRERAIIDETGGFSIEAAQDAALRRMQKRATPHVEEAEDDSPPAKVERKQVEEVEQAPEPREKIDPTRPDFNGEQATARFLNDLMDETGQELTDEDLRKLWGKRRYANWDDAFADARKLSETRASKQAKQDAIGFGAMASEPGRPAPSGDVESWVRELDAIHRGERGSPSSPRNAQRRRELRSKIAGAR